MSEPRRKRSRPSSFDLYKATLPVERKYQRSKKGNIMETASQPEAPRVWDFSQTINTTQQTEGQSTSQNIPQFVGGNGEMPSTSQVRPQFVTDNTNEHPTDDLDPSIRNMVTQSVEVVQQNPNTMVKESVAQGMQRVYQMINQINENIKTLSEKSQSTGGLIPDRGVNNRSNVNFREVPRTSQILTNQNTTNRSETANVQASLGWQTVGLKGCRVEKFGILFDGNQNRLSVDDFVFRVEHLQ